MRQTLTRIGLATSIAAAFFLLPAAPAEAAHKKARWTVGGNFSVGGLHFSVYYRPGYYDDYYYRVRKPFPPSRHYRCSDRCYFRRGYNYHHASCARAHEYFDRHHFSPVRVLDAIFYPRGHRYHRRGYDRGYGHYDRGHRHGSSCRDRRYHRRGDHYYGYRGGYYGDDSDSDSHRHRY